MSIKSRLEKLEVLTPSDADCIANALLLWSLGSDEPPPIGWIKNYSNLTHEQALEYLV
jgi:hypothetical protein